jgi:8-oxo-dGTP diphosphatase
MTEAEAAVAILRAREKDSILLIRRAERDDDSWSGHWSLPGGRRSPGDPDLLVTALRELEEECNIRLGRDALVSELPLAIARRRAGPFVPVAPFLFAVERELPAMPDQREAVAAIWLPLAVLLDPARHRMMPVPRWPANVLYPGIDLDGVPLWGFTYRLLTEWLGLGPESGAAGRAGLEAACLVLNFLLSRGLALERGWQACPDGGGAIQAAAVKGRIPVEAVLARFSEPGRHVPALNRLEVRSEYIRLAGPDFEEYLIAAGPLPDMAGRP